MLKTGIELIAEERQRQKWTADHDDTHSEGELAMAAACFASPKEIYELRQKSDKTVLFEDPFPWGESYNSRGTHRWHHFSTKEKKEGKSRIRQLQIAGALIAAEIDRINRQTYETK